MKKKAVVIAALVCLGVLLFYAIGEMPRMGDSDTPDKTHVASRYNEMGREEAGSPNLVTAVILNYRGYDTMGEVAVIFCALCAVIAVLDREKKGLSRSGMEASPVRSSVVIRTIVRLIVPVIIFFAIYTMLHGDESPGGGFQGGAIIGAAVILFTVVFGLSKATDRIPLRFRVPLESTAVLVFIAAGLLGTVFGVSFLTYMLPGLSEFAAETVREIMFIVIELSIGFAGGIIFTSIMFAMIREDEYELQPDTA